MAGSKGLKRTDAGDTLTKVEYHDETGIEIVSGTTFPASPSQKDLYYRTDLNAWYQHTGGEWRATGEPHLPVRYLVWKEGSTYYRKDGNTGQVNTSATASTIIQAAIDAVNSAGGGIVFVKAGTYIITVQIDLKEKVGIVGEGIEATIFEAGANIKLFSLASTSLKTDFLFSDFSIDGKKATYTGTHGIYMARCVHRVKVKRLYIHHCGTFGLYIGKEGETGNVEDITIENSFFDNCGYDGSPVQEHNVYCSECKKVKISNCISTNAYNMGYQIRGTGIEDIEFVNCIAESNNDSGFYVCDNGIINCVLTNCISKDNGDYGFWIGYTQTTKRVSLENCIAEGNTLDGVRVGHADKAAEEISIIGGHFYGNGAYGIIVCTPCNYFIILGANARGNTSGALSYPTVEKTYDVDHNLPP